MDDRSAARAPEIACILPRMRLFTITIAAFALSSIITSCGDSTSGGSGAATQGTGVAQPKRDGGVGGEPEEPGGW